MKRIRRMSVALGVGGGEDGKEESGSEDEFDQAPDASAVPDFLANAGNWKAGAEPEPEPEPEPAAGGKLKRGLRRMSVTMLSLPTSSAPKEEKYAAPEQGQDGATPLAGQLPSTKSEGNLGAQAKAEGKRSRFGSKIFGDGGPSPNTAKAQAERQRLAREEEEAAQLAAVEQEERQKKLMADKLRDDRERAERERQRARETEEAEARSKAIIRARHEQLAKEKHDRENEEAVERIKRARRQAEKEKKQARLEEQKARAMGNRDQKREAAWKLYEQQMERAAQGGGAPHPSAVQTGADLLWRVVAPGASVCEMENAKAEIMEQVNGIAPLKTAGGKLQRAKLVVVGLGGPAGSGKTVLAEWLRDDAEALLLTLESFSKKNVGSSGVEHPGALNAELLCKTVVDFRQTFCAEIPAGVERDLEAEANMEAIRRKLYAASYAAGGQDWHKLFQAVDKDRSGELGFQEFKTAVRKGAKLSPTVVSDDSLRVLFKAVDADDSGSISAPEFADFLNTKNRNAEDSYGTKRMRKAEVPLSRLLVLEGSNVFHPALLPHLDIQVFLTGPPHLSVARAMAREMVATRLSPHKILQQLSGHRSPIQAIHANRSAASAHILVRNRWSPIVDSDQNHKRQNDGKTPAQRKALALRGKIAKGEPSAEQAKGNESADASDENDEKKKSGAGTAGGQKDDKIVGGPVHTMCIERGETLESWAKLVDWVRGSVKNSAGLCVSHGRHSTVHSALPEFGDEVGAALRGYQGSAAKAKPDGDSSDEDDVKNAADKAEGEDAAPSVLYRGVRLDKLPPWPDAPGDPMPPALTFTRAVLLPPRDPLDDGSEDAEFGPTRPRRWVAMSDMGGTFTYAWCEREPGEHSETVELDESATGKNGAAKVESRGVSHRVDSSWSWPVVGDSSTVRDLLGLGYTLTALEEVQAHAFVVPTSHLKDKVVRPFPGASPFAAKAREIVEHREATRKQEARRQKREEEQGKPVWQRKKMDTTQTLDATMGTVQHSF